MMEMLAGAVLTFVGKIICAQLQDRIFAILHVESIRFSTRIWDVFSVIRPASDVRPQLTLQLAYPVLQGSPSAKASANLAMQNAKHVRNLQVHAHPAKTVQIY